MSKVVVFGANGLLGSRLCPYLRNAGLEVVTAGRSDHLDYTLDVTDQSVMQQFFDTIQPNQVINLIAATNVDQCELDSAMATRVNALIPWVISRASMACQTKRIHLVQVSTDQVYDGSGEHIEDEVAPVNVYGLSKLTGELLMNSEQTTVLRTNFFGKSPLETRPSFSDWLVNSFKEGKSITLFKDVHFSALHMSSLCQIIQKVLETRVCGTFNVGCRDGITKADFGLALAADLGLPTTDAKLGNLSDMALKARRPLDMTLNVKRLEGALGIQCPDIREEISKTVKEYADA
jgi:dTDP-4-dehydrorhamnose reductase